LIARVYLNAGINFPEREYWLPMHFLSSSSHKTPRNVIFEGFEDLEAQRFSKKIDRLSDALLKSVEK
jgi:hypothetical protein